MRAHRDEWQRAAAGEIYLVSPQSVARHYRTDRRTLLERHGRDCSRPTTERRARSRDAGDTQRQPAATSDQSQHVERLEREVEQTKDERDFLREQIDRKDKTIEALIERDRKTNFLIRGLQNLIPRLDMSCREPDLPRYFRTKDYLRDCPPNRREACASRDLRTSRL